MSTSPRMILFPAALIFCVALATSNVEAGYSAIAHLTLVGQPGNQIVSGNVDVTYTDFVYGYNTSSLGTLPDGTPDYLRFIVDQKGSTSDTLSELYFSTSELGIGLTPGTTYTNAHRDDFATGTTAGLDVDFNNLVYPALTGSFTVNALTTFHDPSNGNALSVASFSVSFTELGQGATGSLSGTFTYQNLAAVPEPASLAMVAMGLIGLAGYRRLRLRRPA